MTSRPAQFRLFTLAVAAAALVAAPALPCAPNPSKETPKQTKPEAMPKAPELADATLNEDVYRNPFFGLEFKLPSGWGELGAKIEDAAAAPQAYPVSAAKVDVPQSPGFFALLRSAPLSQEMPQINIVAQNISTAPQIKRGEDFVNLLSATLQRAGWQKIRGPELLEISGQQFWRTEVVEHQSGIMEGMVFTVTRGYAVGFLLVAPDRNQLSALYRHVRAVKIEPSPTQH